MNRYFLCGMVFLASASMSMNSFAGTTDPVAELLQRCSASYAKINDYTCVLHRKDLVHGELKKHSDVIFKYKRPSRFYMKWPKDKIEAIYAEGRYSNKMVIHGGLLFKFVSIAVKPEAALKYNRHTIPEADIGHILKIMETNYRSSRDNNDAVIVIEKDEILDTRKTWRIKAVFPQDKDYYGHIVYLNIDKELYLPIKIEVYGWKQELLEEYYYQNLQVNVGLKEEDFDVNNSRYSFKMGY